MERPRKPSKSYPLLGCDSLVLSLTISGVCVQVLTFLSYAAYHGARKPPSIVKSVLHPSSMTSTSEAVGADDPSLRRRLRVNEGGWAPFNNSEQGLRLLGSLDLSFLTAYAIGMFYAGTCSCRTVLVSAVLSCFPSTACNPNPCHFAALRAAG